MADKKRDPSDDDEEGDSGSGEDDSEINSAEESGSGEHVENNSNIQKPPPKPASANDEDEEEFEFARAAKVNSRVSEEKSGSAEPKGEKKVETFTDQHFDEAMAVSEDEESVDDSSMSYDQAPAKQVDIKAPAPAAGRQESHSSEDDDDDDEEEGDSSEEEEEPVKAAPVPVKKADEAPKSVASKPAAATVAKAAAAPAPKPVAKPVPEPADSRGEDDDDDEEDGDEGSTDSSSEEEEDKDKKGSSEAFQSATTYNPEDFRHLNVSSEIRDLFEYISRHKPADVELETKLKPFIPDFIPAVGEIDSFLKVPRPDGKEEELGLVMLDEPAANQSDPTVLDIKIRVMSKHSGVKPMTVRSIEHADKNPKKITSWISNIEEVHRKKTSPRSQLLQKYARY